MPDNPGIHLQHKATPLNVVKADSVTGHGVREVRTSIVVPPFHQLTRAMEAA